MDAIKILFCVIRYLLQDSQRRLSWVNIPSGLIKTTFSPASLEVSVQFGSRTIGVFVWKIINPPPLFQRISIPYGVRNKM